MHFKKPQLEGAARRGCENVGLGAAAAYPLISFFSFYYEVKQIERDIVGMEPFLDRFSLATLQGLLAGLKIPLRFELLLFFSFLSSIHLY